MTFWSPEAKTTRRFKIGDAERMPLSKARAAARKHLAAVEVERRDPQAEHNAAKVAAAEERRRRAAERKRAAEDRGRRSITFSKVCEEFVEYRRTEATGKQNRPAQPNTVANMESIIRCHVLPTIGDVPPEDMTAELFLNVMERAVKNGGPTMGPRVHAFLSSIWKWAEQRSRRLGVKLPDKGPLLGLPTVGVESSRDRVLSPSEVWKFWRATGAEERLGEAMRLTLLTATRVREATELPWSEVDLPAARWTLPATRNKGARERKIPLSPQAVALLRRVKALGDEGSRVFGGGRLSDVVGRVRVAMGGEPWQSRDLRRTAATLCARLGADPYVARAGAG